MSWWVQDKSGHRRGPLSAYQIDKLLGLGLIELFCNVLEDNSTEWIPMTSCNSLLNALSREQSPDKQDDTTDSSRLPISDVPSLESSPCVDPTCPVYPACDRVYLWDRKWRMYLTYEEYVQVCIEDGLTKGLPEHVLPTTTDQVQQLLSEADSSRLVIPRRELHRNPGKNNSSESDDEPLSDPEKEAKRQKKRAYRERKKLKRMAGLWVKSKTNPNIYVSCLPVDVQFDELEQIFKRAGQIKADPQTATLRIKLYGNGDALITYMHQESVALAISLFNEYEIRPGFIISVQQADFSESAVDASSAVSNLSTEQLRELAQLNRDSRKKMVEFQRKEKALNSAWDIADYGIGSTHRPVVVFTNCFDPREDDSPDYEFLESEISIFCQPFEIKKINSIRNSIEGYICVRFKDGRDAEALIARMIPIGDETASEPQAVIANRKISAFIHDGRDLTTNIYIPPEESSTNIPQSDQQHAWESFLEDEVDSDDEDLQIRTE
jgi:hypothetical protein